MQYSLWSSGFDLFTSVATNQKLLHECTRMWCEDLESRDAQHSEDS